MIIHVVRVKQNKDGDLETVHFKDCPYYRETNKRRICHDNMGFDSCPMLIENNIIKQVKDYYLLECRYKPKTKTKEVKSGL